MYFRLLQLHSFLLQNLVLKVAYFHYFVVMEHIIGLMVDVDQNLVFVPLLTIDLETLALFWAISNTLAHQTSPLTWEKLIILDQI